MAQNECGHTWEAGKKDNPIEHICTKDANHSGKHRCACGAVS